MLPMFADEHVHTAIVKGLRRRGADVTSVQERGLVGRPDPVLLQIATTEGRLMLTQDQDFLGLNAQWIAAGRDHAGIVFWRREATSIGQVIAGVIRFATDASPEQARNHVIFL